ncbi:MAG: hypothetical protein SAJ12_10965 [Jaaginema sp. PMC 1079.18]|nr:hypothetical protein [Jaaginema sp. PMC 1080.18]MEC4851523.1 hypothetical protein [Jaaginema sp. PMC 1079.18]MEC4867971.1 hypothetical protein [Jaaginema sp. PMC 1078.18]
MKFKQILTGLLLATTVMATANVAEAQRRPPGVASLAEMSCQRINGRYQASNEDVPIGFEVFRAVAYLANGPDRIEGDQSVKVACRLAAAGQNATYRSLTLSFGLSDQDSRSSGSTVRLSIYKDGNFYEYRDITSGQKFLWNIDVRGTRSLGLEGTCLRSSPRAVTCPKMYFFEDILE